jgi:hypothetical protein
MSANSFDDGGERDNPPLERTGPPTYIEVREPIVRRPFNGLTLSTSPGRICRLT